VETTQKNRGEKEKVQQENAEEKKIFAEWAVRARNKRGRVLTFEPNRKLPDAWERKAVKKIVARRQKQSIGKPTEESRTVGASSRVKGGSDHKK